MSIQEDASVNSPLSLVNTLEGNKTADTVEPATDLV